MKISPIVLISLLGTAAFLPLPQQAQAASNVSVQLSGMESVHLNLMDEQNISFTVQASAPAEIHFAVDTSELEAEIEAGSVATQLSPNQVSLTTGNTASLSLRIKTLSSAPSLTERHLGVIALVDGKAAGQIQISLSIQAVYVVKVVDGNPFGFDSPDTVLPFLPHPEGLQLRFENFSSQACVIHGEGAIEHQDIDHPMAPAVLGADGQLHIAPDGSYSPALILPDAGANAAGYYTIHGVYHPERHLIFNSTK